MKDARNVWIKLVKLVDDFSTPDVPENSVVEDKIVRRVERRPVSRVVVRNVTVDQLQGAVP